jgi:hypothetical protein
MKRTTWLASALFIPWLSAGSARADFVSYTFTGTDMTSGATLTGTFSYQSSSPATSVLPSETIFGNVHGELRLSLNGHTESTTSVSAILQTGSLQLFSNNAGGGRGFAIDLTTRGPGAVLFPSLSSLPGTLNAKSLSGSTFSIYATPASAGPLGGTPTYIALLDRGPITLLDSVNIAESAPEPSAWLLAACGVVAVAARAARGYGRVARAQA